MKGTWELFLRITIGIVIAMTTILAFQGVQSGSVQRWVLNSGTLKEDVWTTATRQSGSYHGKYDVQWVSKLFKSLKIECKLQKSPGSNEYDFVSKMTGFLSFPKMSSEAKENVSRYQINVEFSFIDSDGFVLFTLETFSPQQSLPHSNYPSLLEWENYGNEREITAMNIRKKIIPEDVANRVTKITFKPRLDY